MTKLTDEELSSIDYHILHQHRTNTSLPSHIIRSLIAEVREGRRVVEIEIDPAVGLHFCPDCHEGGIVPESKHCRNCGKKIIWKD